MFFLRVVFEILLILVFIMLLRLCFCGLKGNLLILSFDRLRRLLSKDKSCFLFCFICDKYLFNLFLFKLLLVIFFKLKWVKFKIECIGVFNLWDIFVRNLDLLRFVVFVIFFVCFSCVVCVLIFFLSIFFVFKSRFFFFFKCVIFLKIIVSVILLWWFILLNDFIKGIVLLFFLSNFKL